jgi:hypothetical protein
MFNPEPCSECGATWGRLNGFWEKVHTPTCPVPRTWGWLTQQNKPRWRTGATTKFWRVVYRTPGIRRHMDRKYSPYRSANRSTQPTNQKG